MILFHRFERVLAAYSSPLIRFHSAEISIQDPPFSFSLNSSRSSELAVSQLLGMGIPLLRSFDGDEAGVVRVRLGRGALSGVWIGLRGLLVGVNVWAGLMRTLTDGVGMDRVSLDASVSVVGSGVVKVAGSWKTSLGMQTSVRGYFWFSSWSMSPSSSSMVVGLSISSSSWVMRRNGSMALVKCMSRGYGIGCKHGVVELMGEVGSEKREFKSQMDGEKDTATG